MFVQAAASGEAFITLLTNKRLLSSMSWQVLPQHGGLLKRFMTVRTDFVSGSDSRNGYNASFSLKQMIV